MSTNETLSRKIIGKLATQPEGQPVTAKSLLHLGTRAAVDQALSRLARCGRITRLARGLYVLPIATRFGARAPSVEKTVEALAALLGETVVLGGASAANRLGLSTQVPVRPVYLTSGANRILAFGKQTVEFRHAPAWQLVEPASRVGDLIRALSWLGREQAIEGALKLVARMSESERSTLAQLRPRMPEWLARSVSETARAHG